MVADQTHNKIIMIDRPIYRQVGAQSRLAKGYLAATFYALTLPACHLEAENGEILLGSSGIMISKLIN